MLRDEPLELADQCRVKAAGEIGLDSVLDHGEPQLVKTGALSGRELLEGEVRERGAPPEGERFAEAFGCLLGFTGRQRPAPVLGKPLEPVQVEVLRLELHKVARCAGHDDAASAAPLPPGLERLSQARDVDLEEIPRRFTGLLAEERVDERVARNDLVRAREEDREQGALPWASEIDRPIAVDDLKRPEDAELHRRSFYRRCKSLARGAQEPDRTVRLERAVPSGPEWRRSGAAFGVLREVSAGCAGLAAVGGLAVVLPAGADQPTDGRDGAAIAAQREIPAVEAYFAARELPARAARRRSS